VSILEQHSAHDTEDSFVDFAVSQCNPNNDDQFLLRFTTTKQIPVFDRDYTHELSFQTEQMLPHYSGPEVEITEMELTMFRLWRLPRLSYPPEYWITSGVKIEVCKKRKDKNGKPLPPLCYADIDPFLGGNHTTPRANDVRVVDCDAVIRFIGNNSSEFLPYESGAPFECHPQSAYRDSYRLLMVVASDHLSTHPMHAGEVGTRILRPTLYYGMGTRTAFSRAVNDPRERDGDGDTLCGFGKKTASLYRDQIPKEFQENRYRSPWGDGTYQGETYVWFIPIKQSHFACERPDGTGGEPRRFHTLLSDSAYGRWFPIIPLYTVGEIHRWRRYEHQLTARVTLMSPLLANDETRQYTNLDPSVPYRCPDNRPEVERRKGRHVCVGGHLELEYSGTWPAPYPSDLPPSYVPPEPADRNWPGQPITAVVADPPWVNGDTQEPTNPAYANASRDPVSTGHNFCGLGGDNNAGAGFPGSGFGCRSTRPTAGDGRAYYTFTTSQFGGDNYRWRVCLFPDCGDFRNPSHNSAWSRSLTVWRKLYVFKDLTKGCDEVPFKANGACDQNLGLVEGAFDDAFYETEIRAAGTSDVPDWLTGQPDQLCTQAATNEPIWGAGRGIVRYQHEMSIQDMPHAPHGVNSLGTRLIADDYALPPGSPEGSAKKYFTPSEGTTCIEENATLEHHARHSALSVWYIGHPERNDISWLSARFFGAVTLEDWCDDPDNEGPGGPHKVPDNFCLGHAYNEVRRDILISRMSLHEVGHSVLRSGDHRGMQCGGPAQDWDWNASIMRYSCVFDDRFGGWFSKDQIATLRAGGGRQ